MPTKLDSLLETIDPQNLHADVARRIDEAFNSFTMGPGQIQRTGDIEGYLASFHRHIENHLLGLPLDFPVLSLDAPSCLALLKERYGRKSRTVYEVIKTGVEGGLLGVLKSIAELKYEEHTKRHVSHHVNDFVRDMTFEERKEAAEEYIAKCGYLLPPEYSRPGNPEVMVNLNSFLMDYPRLLIRYRSGQPV